MNPDTIATIILAAVALLLAAAVTYTEPGAIPRYLHARRYHRAGLARHARTAVSLSALETVPDPVSLHVARPA